jgi:hypothetical protein
MTGPIGDEAGRAPTPCERWVGFLRGYGPVSRLEGMYAETLPKHARTYGFPPLLFEHPLLGRLLEALDPAAGRLTNVVLTGTAGDGKTTLCHELWQRFGGSDERATGKNRQNYLPLDVDTPAGKKRLHFIFEFSGWCPEKDQPWPEDRLDLLDRFHKSLHDPDPEEFFIIAANDGRLIQAFDGLPEVPAKSLAPEIEELLAGERSELASLNLLFLNLSRMATRDILERAIACLTQRPEWSCLETEADDLAFSAASPFVRNYRLLCDNGIRDRLLALADLMDSNGLHVSIREILMLLVNGLLGWADAREHVATAQDLRELVERGVIHQAALYGNLFGANLSERRRENLTVFRYLGGFRIGHETTNLLDSLLIFGRDDPSLQADHAAYLESDTYYGENPEFEQLRRQYLEAEDERVDGAEPFLDALVNERRRLFFRLPDNEDRLNPWQLTIFPSAGSYRRQVLEPLRSGRAVETIILQRLVCGLNRIWTGMLAGDLDRLFLSTGLDFTSAKVSDIYLCEVPLRRSMHGEEVTIAVKDQSPFLRVSLGGGDEPIDFALWLVRYEFLSRVAQGALPSSFSKECNEDVLAFKSLVLSQYYRRVGDALTSVSILRPGERGTLSSHQLGISL